MVLTMWIATVLAFVVGLTTPARAESRHQVRYIGIHPIPKSEGSGICHIEGPHVHLYAADKLQYRVHNGASYFVGDPVAYGFDGPRYAYKGNHPIHVDVVVADGHPDVEYCYLDGPHYHAFAPPDGPDFKLVGDAYFFVGTPAKAYLDARPALLRINPMYRPLAYDRPVVAVEAPSGWIGARTELLAPVVVAPRLHADVDFDLYMVGPRPIYIEQRPVVVREGWRRRRHKEHEDD